MKQESPQESPQKLENNEVQSSQSPDAKKQEEPTVSLEIVRYKQLFDLLEKPRAVMKLIVIIIFIVLLLFLVLTTAALVIKHYYPYNDINTNLYGATTVKNEDKEVTYWLFNTAEMWANSGITVEENDIITVRASGAWHTAIHHLVKDTKENRPLSNQWITVDGLEHKQHNDEFRTRFRISPGDINGVILMGVFPMEKGSGGEADSERVTQDFLNTIDSIHYPIYRIGRERMDIRILSPGTLYFTVNSVVFTRKKIKEMYSAFVKELYYSKIIDKKKYDDIVEWVGKWPSNPEDTIVFSERIREIDKDLQDNTTSFSRVDNPELSTDIHFGGYDKRDSAARCLDNELIYYYNKNYYNAWYDDNLGSALIVVERKKK